MAPPEVCVVGEINPDLILYGLPAGLKPDHEILMDGFRLTLGSSSAIFAHNLAALGTNVGMVSKIGTDAFGKMTLGWLTEAGVDVSRVRTDANVPTGITVILANRDGRYILTYPGSMFELRYQDLDLDYIYSARHLHLSSFYLQKGLRPHIGELFRNAKSKGLTTSLDTNDDPSGEWREDVLEILKFVDIFFPNESEAKKITRTEDLNAAIQILCRAGKLVVVKRGPEGANAYDGKREWHASTLPLVARDAVGAGDSFDAGFVRRFLDGASIEDCLGFANIAGAYSTTAEGGIEAFRDREKMREFFSKYLKTKTSTADRATKP